MKDVKLFQSSQIRSVWNDEAGEWFFSAKSWTKKAPPNAGAQLLKILICRNKAFR